MALTVKLEARPSAQPVRKWPGARAWFDDAVADVFKLETPALDGDLTGNDPVEAVFKIPFKGEPEYKRALALAASLSRVTTGWQWTVSLDIEAMGESFFGPVDVAFVEGDAVVDASAVRTYIGSRPLKTWADLQPPEAPIAMPVVRVGVAARIEGKQAKEAIKSARGRFLDQLWPHTVPSVDGQTLVLAWVEPSELVLFLALVQSLTSDHTIVAHLTAQRGVLEALGLGPTAQGGVLDGGSEALLAEISAAGEDLPGMEAPRPVDALPFAWLADVAELEEHTLFDRRCWHHHGVLVAFEDDGALAVRGRMQTGAKPLLPASIMARRWPDHPSTASVVGLAMQQALAWADGLDAEIAGHRGLAKLRTAIAGAMRGERPAIGAAEATAMHKWDPSPLFEALKWQLVRAIPAAVTAELSTVRAERAQARRKKRSVSAVLRVVGSGKDDASELDAFDADAIVSAVLTKPALVRPKNRARVQQALEAVDAADHIDTALQMWRGLDKKSVVKVDWLGPLATHPHMLLQWMIDVASGDRGWDVVERLGGVDDERATAVLLDKAVGRLSRGHLFPKEVRALRARSPQFADAIVSWAAAVGVDDWRQRCTGPVPARSEVDAIRAPLDAFLAPHKPFLDACWRCDTPQAVLERLKAGPPTTIRQRVRDAIVTMRTNEADKTPNAPIVVTFSDPEVALEMTEVWEWPTACSGRTVTVTPDLSGRALAEVQARITRAAAEADPERVVIVGPDRPQVVHLLDGHARFADGERHDHSGHCAVLRNWDIIVGLDDGPLHSSAWSDQQFQAQLDADTKALGLTEEDATRLVSAITEGLRAGSVVSLGEAGSIAVTPRGAKWSADCQGTALDGPAGEVLARILAHVQAGQHVDIADLGEFLAPAHPERQSARVSLDRAFRRRFID